MCFQPHPLSLTELNLQLFTSIFHISISKTKVPTLSLESALIPEFPLPLDKRCHSSSPPGESPWTSCFSHRSAPLLHTHIYDVYKSFPSLLLPIPYLISGLNSSLQNNQYLFRYSLPHYYLPPLHSSYCLDLKGRIAIKALSTGPGLYTQYMRAVAAVITTINRNCFQF